MNMTNLTQSVGQGHVKELGPVRMTTDTADVANGDPETI